MGLSDEIRQCTKCIDLGLAGADRLNVHEKPYVEFHVEKKWKPDKVNVLFVAESPPWNGKQSYFYNPNRSQTGLRAEVLKDLGLGSLEDFRDKKGYFLIDTIKCRLNKSNKKNVPSLVTRTCATRFLHREIVDLEPKTIFVLEKTAKQALEEFPELQPLKKHLSLPASPFLLQLA
jgi:uracil-DNA glycosylase